MKTKYRIDREKSKDYETHTWEKGNFYVDTVENAKNIAKQYERKDYPYTGSWRIVAFTMNEENFYTTEEVIKVFNFYSYNWNLKLLDIEKEELNKEIRLLPNAKTERGLKVKQTKIKRLKENIEKREKFLQKFY